MSLLIKALESAEKGKQAELKEARLRLLHLLIWAWSLYLPQRKPLQQRRHRIRRTLSMLLRQQVWQR